MKRILNHLKQLRVFLIVSLVLGILDVFLTDIALGYGLKEGSPLHNFLGVDTLLSGTIAILGVPSIIILGSIKLKGKLFPHILVLIQLLNVTASIVVVLLLKVDRLLIP